MFYSDNSTIDIFYNMCYIVCNIKEGIKKMKTKITLLLLLTLTTGCGKISKNEIKCIEVVKEEPILYQCHEIYEDI